MLMRLQHKRPDGEVDTYHLKPGRKYFFGRGSTCEIRILDLKLSRKHCLLEWIDDGWHVEDLGSTNGARLNGQPLANARSLTVGAVIEAGGTALTIAGFIDGSKTPSEEADSDEDSAALRARVEQLPLPEKGDDAPLAESTLMANDWELASDQVHTSTGALQPLSAGNPATNGRAKVAEKPAAPAVSAKSAPRPALGLDDGDGNASAIMPGNLLADTAPLTAKRPASKSVQSATAEPFELTLPGEAAKPQNSAIPANPANPPSSSAPPTRPTRIKPVTIRVGRIDGADQDEAHPATSDDLVFASGVPEVAINIDEPVAAPTPKVPTAPFQPVQPVVIAGSAVPSTPPRTAPSTNAHERTFYITVLGRRVGPLTRLDARDLKSRELKGTLSMSDLETYPQA